MQLFVRADHTLAVDVTDGGTVLDIKQAVELREGVPCKEQRLVYGGRQLRDAKAFSEYGIGRDSTLHLVLRLVGGKGGFGALLRSGARGSKTENFDACRDLSGRRLRHVNADKQLAEWAAEAQERELEKVALKHIKDMDRAAAREVRMEIDIDSVRVEQQQNQQSVLSAVHDALATNGLAAAAGSGLGPAAGIKRSGGSSEMGHSPPPAAKRPRGGYMPLGLDGSDSDSDAGGAEDAVSRLAVQAPNSAPHGAPREGSSPASAAAPLVRLKEDPHTDPQESAAQGQQEGSAASAPALPLPACSLGSSAGGDRRTGSRMTSTGKAVISTVGSDLTTAEGSECQLSVSCPACSVMHGGGGGGPPSVTAASVVATAGAAESVLVAQASVALSADGPAEADVAATMRESGPQESHVNGAAPAGEAEPGLSMGSNVAGDVRVVALVIDTSAVEQGLPVAEAVPAHLDLQALSSVAELECLGLDVLKAALQKWGLKCGGNAAERASRLWLLKSMPLEKMDRKHFAKVK